MDVSSVELHPRSIMGKKVNRLRRQGIVPVHVYGTDQAPQYLQVEAQILRRLLPRVGTNVPVNVAVAGEKDGAICFVREVQRHPVTDELLHVDFMRVDASRRMRVEVPITLQGIAPAARQLGGTLVQQLPVLLVECLPMEVPERLDLDVSVLDEFEKSLYVRDIAVGASVTVLTPPDELVCRVLQPRLIEEEEVEVEEEGVEVEEGEEGAEAPEGEEAPEDERGGERGRSR